LYAEKIRVGYGLYMDMFRGTGTHPWYSDNPDANYMTPDRLEDVMRYALEEGDGYVWVYSENPTWWFTGPDDAFDPDVTFFEDENHGWVDPAYRQAVLNALPSATHPGVATYFDNYSGNGRWDNASNWSDGVVPQAGDNPHLGGNRTVFIDSSVHAAFGDLEAGVDASDTDLPASERSAAIGNVTFNQTGGTATGRIYLGWGSGDGTWNLSGGNIQAELFQMGTNGATAHLNVSNDGHLRQIGTNVGWYLRLGVNGGAGFISITDDGIVSARRLDIGPGSCIDIWQNGKLILDGNLSAQANLLGWISDGQIIAYGGMGIIDVIYNAESDQTELTAISVPEPEALGLLACSLVLAAMRTTRLFQ
jgi:hypothetical protein